MTRLVALFAALLAAGPAFAQSLTPEKLALIKSAAVYIIVKDPDHGGGTGSGFVVRKDGNDLLIVTNHHVVEPQFKVLAAGQPLRKASKQKVSVVFDSGAGADKERTVAGTIIAVDPDRDLAVVKVTGVKNPPKPLDIEKPPALSETMPVFACGFPFGERLAEGDKHPEITITPCTVSAIRKDEIGRLRTVQLAGNLNPGNSGGPVVAADGKVIGVAVRSILGSGIGEAVPQQEIGTMFAGRPGRITLIAKENAENPEEKLADISVNLIDPLGVIKSVKCHYRKGPAPDAPKADTPPEMLNDATSLDLTIADSQATGVLKARGTAVVQLEVETASGRLMTFPLEVLVRKPPSATPENDGGLEAGGMRTGKPRFRGRDGKVQELPAFPLKEKPTASDTSVSLGELNRKGGDYVGKSITIEGLSDCQIIAADGKFEIVVLTDSGQPPRNLKVLLPRDLAMQFSEIFLPDVGGFTFALRLEGKIERTKQADAFAFEASEVMFLSPDAKPVTTLKSVEKPETDKPTLSLVNRFPESFKGKKITIDGFVTGATNSGKEYGLRVNHANNMPVLNLRFFTAKDLSEQVETDLPREGALARLECVVEAIDAKDGAGILGVTSLSLLNGDGKTGKAMTTEGKILYPTTAPPAPPKEIKTAKTGEATGVSAAKPDAKADTGRRNAGGDAPKNESNLTMYLAAGGGGLFVVFLLFFFVFVRKKAAAALTAPKYGAKKQSATKLADGAKPAAKAPPASPPPAAPPAPKPAAKPAAKPRPAPGGDNPFANLE